MSGLKALYRRWSRRKALAREARREEASAFDGQRTASDERVACCQPEPSDRPKALSADLPKPPVLPDVETLGRDSDFTVFMAPGVPEALRNQALRKLWRLDPVLVNLDGMNDYDEDFTRATTTEIVRTAYRVGRGMAPEAASDAGGQNDVGDSGSATSIDETKAANPDPARG